MNKSELRTNIRNLLLENFDYVEESFIYPDEYAATNNDFPYVTIVFNQWIPTGASKYGIQSFDLIGITSGDAETISDKIDEVENKIIASIYNKSTKINITLIDNNNLFAPFGLNAGVFLPYAGVRVSCEVSNVK